MAQLRTRKAKSEETTQPNTKKTIQKKSASNMKSIVQTFVAKDHDVKSKMIYMQEEHLFVFSYNIA